MSVRVSVPLYFDHCLGDIDALNLFDFPPYLGVVWSVIYYVRADIKVYPLILLPPNLLRIKTETNVAVSR